jgi:hypothetical protein
LPALGSVISETVEIMDEGRPSGVIVGGGGGVGVIALRYAWYTFAMLTDCGEGELGGFSCLAT